ncbi:glycosyltransferase family 2 protein [Streptomyces sp. NPDC041068]|uniref:glycosyltransferase family 2 protein n=1 Tax=Streptomyces sp. NPDC041068 TaxID=3155130 RepID=UPI0033E11EE3
MHTLLVIVSFSVLAAMAARNGAFWLRMWRQPAVLKRERAEVRAAAAASDPATRRARDAIQLHYVIPAFQEVESLEKTFLALRQSIEASSYHATITVVTSVHEPHGPGVVSTHTVAQALCDRFADATCLMDRSDVPSMAAAFNTGMRDVARRGSGDAERTYVVVYNGDSTAAPDSVQALGDTLVARSCPAAAQINFLSLRNVDEITGPGRWYTVGAAYYQTRWAFGFEYDLHRRNSAAHRQGPLGHSYHLKGHGLALRLDTALDVGGFSTQTPCEDLELGFRLALRRVPVHVVPVLEDTEHPTTAAAVTAQKRYWYSGMVDVLQFHWLLPEYRAAQPLRFELSRLASIYRSAGCFLLGPVPYWFLVAAAVVLGQPALAVLPFLNAALSAYLIRRAAGKLGRPLPPLRPAEYVLLPVGILLWSLTRNIGPVQYLWSMVRSSDRQGRLRATHLRHLDDDTEKRPV